MSHTAPSLLPWPLLSAMLLHSLLLTVPDLKIFLPPEPITRLHALEVELLDPEPQPLAPEPQGPPDQDAPSLPIIAMPRPESPGAVPAPPVTNPVTRVETPQPPPITAPTQPPRPARSEPVKPPPHKTEPPPRPPARAPESSRPATNAKAHPPSAGQILASRVQEITDSSVAEFSAPSGIGSSRRRTVQSTSQEYLFAAYLENWRHKIERIGQLNYPEEARRKQLYGTLVLQVSVHADGTLEKVLVTRSSGHRLLDDAAMQIVRLSAPFAPFPPDMKAQLDTLDITRTWRFQHEQSSIAP